MMMVDKPRALLWAAASFALIAPLLLAAQTGPSTSRSPASQTMLHTPASIAAEHHELHETLARAAREPGETGRAAKALEATLAPHFKREEEIATPPLGLLPQLAKGDVTPEMRSVLPLTQALERELPQMLREHDAIRVAVGTFRNAAQAAKRPEYVGFAEQLAAHAHEEEEILYPAAILIGRYVAHAAPVPK